MIMIVNTLWLSIHTRSLFTTQTLYSNEELWRETNLPIANVTRSRHLMAEERNPRGVRRLFNS